MMLTLCLCRSVKGFRKFGQGVKLDTSDPTSFDTFGDDDGLQSAGFFGFPVCSADVSCIPCIPSYGNFIFVEREKAGSPDWSSDFEKMYVLM